MLGTGGLRRGTGIVKFLAVSSHEPHEHRIWKIRARIGMTTNRPKGTSDVGVTGYALLVGDQVSRLKPEHRNVELARVNSGLVRAPTNSVIVFQPHGL